MKKFKLSILILGIFSLIVVFNVQNARADRLLKESVGRNSSLEMPQYEVADAFFDVTCAERNSSSQARTAADMEGCTSYTTTGSNQYGTFKIKINGVSKFIRVYDNAN